MLNIATTTVRIFLCLCIPCVVSVGALHTHAPHDWEEVKGGSPNAVKGGSTVEHFFMEHEVSQASARGAARKLSTTDKEAPPPGCLSCTDQEMRYCSGLQVVSDHCCCDRKFFEALAYMPHSCYQASTPCTTFADTCSEYHRVRTCCCDSVLREKWKSFSSGHRSSGHFSSSWMLLIGWVAAVLATVHNLLTIK